MLHQEKFLETSVFCWQSQKSPNFLICLSSLWRFSQHVSLPIRNILCGLKFSSEWSLISKNTSKNLNAFGYFYSKTACVYDHSSARDTNGHTICHFPLWLWGWDLGDAEPEWCRRRDTSVLRLCFREIIPRGSALNKGHHSWINLGLLHVKRSVRGSWCILLYQKQSVYIRLIQYFTILLD